MDNNLLADLDLSQYSDSQRQIISQNMYAALEDRVGEKVASLVPDDKFDEFEALVDQANDEKLDEWLDTNVPNYDQIVADELNKLKEEFRNNPTTFLKETSQPF